MSTKPLRACAGVFYCLVADAYASVAPWECGLLAETDIYKQMHMTPYHFLA